MTTLDDLPHERVPSRWELIRDLLVFQGKLFIDGVRDLVMAPLSLFAATLDLLGVGRNAGLHFYEAVRAGRRTESWINLFEAADHTLLSPVRDSRAGLDQIVGRLQDMVVEEYERGGMTSSAKEAVDRALDSVQGRKGRPGDRGRDPGAA